MKCRACWADKAFVRQVQGWRALLHKCFVLTPLKCHHCYHKFSVPSILTIGKQLTPPPLRIAAGTEQSTASMIPKTRTDAPHETLSRPRRRAA